jgi:hypothetical protein
VPDLFFEVTGADLERYAAVPTLSLQLRIDESTGARVQAIALRVQIRIEPQRRRYTIEEEERLYELFGDSRQWGESLRPFLWTQVATTVSSFTGTTEVSLPVHCTYDFEVAGAKYLYGLSSGAIPLLLLFNGTVFGSGATGMLVEPVPWHLEAHYELPVSLWRDVMDEYFPGSSWLRLRRDTIDALGRYKVAQALPTWEQALESLLKAAGADRR